MKVLMVNKFLYPNGGSETYILKLGQCLESQGHEVQYFGMEHEKRCVGNKAEAYTANMDFHSASKTKKLVYSFSTIYSSQARKKIRQVLQDLKPDVVHLNNFNYQLTPSIILEIVKWRKQENRKCRIMYTAHDYQLLCPNHMLNNPNTHENCEKCLRGNFVNCIKGNCIHNSKAKSIVGALEAYFWKYQGVYKYIDKIICCSSFMKDKMDSNSLFRDKTIAIHNFVEEAEQKATVKKNYILYFGRYSKEKGTTLLVDVCKELPEIPFVFAGAGPLEKDVDSVPNIKNVGFKSGEELELLIREALFSVYPSQGYENCPFSVMESQVYGTLVLGANIGGIPELIEDKVTGELFESGNSAELKQKIETLWNDKKVSKEYTKNCQKVKFDTIDEYASKLFEIYE